MFVPENPGPDYELRWPVELFADELRALLNRQQVAPSAADLLLDETFTGSAPRDDLKSGGSFSWGIAGEPVRDFLSRLYSARANLPLATSPRPYFLQRTGGQAPTSGSSLAVDPTKALHRAWAQLVSDLQDTGYLDRVAPRDCVDNRAPAPWDALNAETIDRLGVDGLWPLRSADWTDDLFYSLVEVVHDLVARPRNRSWHDYQGCGWHYSDFAVAPARALYRWKVDRLLARHGIELRLAVSGEDAGRLIRSAGDELDALVVLAKATPKPEDQDAVGHAVALFRGRSATREDKRSAVVALARILENRRALIQNKLAKKDEGALFSIANNFDLRHRNPQQQGDYDEAFLDWIFWWYLATIRLTDSFR